jgi:hypothetical protein
MKLSHTLIVALSLIALPLLAADLSDLTWDASGATVIITDCDLTAAGALVIPDTIGGKVVTTIGNRAFLSCSRLIGIILPDNLTTIEDYAFSWCSGLIGITIPDGVTIIGKHTFQACTRLTSVTIGNSVTSIGDEAFQFCTSLTSINIPEGVNSIGDEAFYQCTSLNSVTIGNSVTSIGDEAFYRCASLVSIDVSVDNSNYSSVDGVLFNKNQTTLVQYPGGKSGTYVIPASVTSIVDKAFAYCTSLTSINISEGVTSIGDWTFADCTSLIDIIIPASVTSIGDEAFSRCTALERIDFKGNLPTFGTDVFTDAGPFYITHPGENAFVLDGWIPFGSPARWHYVAFNPNDLVEVVALKEEVTTLETAATSNATVIATLETIVVSNATEIAVLETAATSNATVIATLETTATSNASEITVLETQVTVLETTATSNATVIAALQAEIATLETTATSNATVIATLEQRPTLEEVQDARLGSVVLIKDEASGEVNFDFNLEETEDLVNWNPVAGGTWTDPGDGGIEVDLPLAGDKRFYRVVVEFE